MFTGAPLRGHVPVIMRLESRTNTEKTMKLWIEKTDWAKGSSFIEGRIVDLIVDEDDPLIFWNEFKSLLLEVADVRIPRIVLQV